MKYKLVCIDIDGTLLNSRKMVTKKTKKVLKEAYDKGVHIVITTGRIFNNAAYYSDLLGVKSVVIAANGGIIREKDEDKIIYIKELEKGKCEKILELAEKYNVGAHFHTPDKVFTNNYWQNIITYAAMSFRKPENRKVKTNVIKTKDEWDKVFKEHSKDIVKCIIIEFNKKKKAKFREELSKISGLEIASSGFYNIEINKEGTSKGEAVKYLADYYGIKREEVIAVGDNENDLSMIKYAGFGVAMGNAIEEVKKEANYVTDTNNNDGVAKLVEKFILK